MNNKEIDDLSKEILNKILKNCNYNQHDFLVNILKFSGSVVSTSLIYVDSDFENKIEHVDFFCDTIKQMIKIKCENI